MIKKISSSISVFGLGYIGCVTLGCLAKAGYKVIGVDINPNKVEAVNSGNPTVLEPGLDELFEHAFNRKLLYATNDVEKAVSGSEIILITVGTPIQNNGDLDLSHIFNVIEDVAKFLANINSYRLIVIRSTVKPGTCQIVSEKIAEISGKIAEVDFSVVANPEFLREGTAISDYYNPPYILIGSNNGKAASKLELLYSEIDAPVIKIQLRTAEIIKYVNNSWHALKVAFGNEIGSICKVLNVDSHEVMNIFCQDKVLNISSYYLKPGFPYGGACLAKDLSGLVALSSEAKIKVPLLESIKTSNDFHIDRAIELIERVDVNIPIGIMGISFKQGTDDVRSSPSIKIIQKLIKHGYKIKVYDETVSKAISSGRNCELIKAELGFIFNILEHDFQSFINYANIFVLAKNDPSYIKKLNILKNIKVIDLVGVKEKILEGKILNSLVR